MKKIYSSLLAIVAVMSLALTLSSCEKDKEDVKILVSWAMEVHTVKSTPAEVNAEVGVVANKMDARCREIFGNEPFYLDADGDKARPTDKAMSTILARFENDSQIISCMKELKAINIKHGVNYVDAVAFGLLCGNSVVGATEFDPNKF